MPAKRSPMPKLEGLTKESCENTVLEFFLTFTPFGVQYLYTCARRWFLLAVGGVLMEALFLPGNALAGC